MSEPFALGVVSSATSVFSGFYQHFKPSRSPYLLAGLLCIVSLVSIADLPNSHNLFFLIFFPICTVFSFLSILCFYFKPFKPETEAEKRAFRTEMDEQFKFSRTVCLSVGILLLTYLFHRALGQPVFKLPGTPLPHAIPTGLFFWITYSACLLHLIIFVCYIMLRNIQEESLIRIPLFQITFFTMALLVGLVFTCAHIFDQTGLFFDSCKYKIEYVTRPGGRIIRDDLESSTPRCDPERAQATFEGKKIEILEDHPKAESFKLLTNEQILNPSKILFWYIFCHLVLFETFWIKRLVSVVSFKFDVVILEPPTARRTNGRRRSQV